MKKHRNSNIELLRIIALFGILLWHISIHGFGFNNIADNPVDYVWQNALCTAVFVPCVNIFVLISGFFGINMSANSVLKLEAQSLFYGYSKIILFVIMGIGLHVGDLFPTIGGTWWFVTTYMILMLAAPIINFGIKNISDKKLLAIIIVWILINGIGKLLRIQINGSNFTHFFLIYIIGAYIRRLFDRSLFDCLKIRYLYLIGVACALLNYIVIMTSIHLGQARCVMPYLSYSNPVVIIYAVIVFVIFLKMHERCTQTINFIASHVFATYLITDGIIGPAFLYKYLRDVFITNVCLGLLLTVVVFIGCIVIEYTRKIVTKPIIMYFSNKINQFS